VLKTIGKTKILFVDDERSIRDWFERFASRRGYDVHLADSGFKALELARKHVFSVVVTDLNMPGLDGLTLIERLRSLQENAQYLIITGDHMTPPPDASVLDVLEKPLDLELLQKSLSKAVELYQDSRATPIGQMKILLVEDEPADRLLVTRFLKLELPNVELQTAVRLSRALEMIKEEEFDVVISDLSLPDASGLECVVQIREMAPHLPLVVLSGLSNESIALEALKKGAQDYLVKEKVDGTILGRALRYAMERKQTEQSLRQLAYYDQVTGIPNRTLFKDRVGHALTRTKRDEGPLALMFCDLDKFKCVNDKHGHDAGDFLLKEVARRLTDAVRESDTVARLGGDEFAVLLERAATLEQVTAVARRIVGCLAEPVLYNGEELKVGTSVGIAIHPEHGFTTDGLLKSADMALYEAKSAGRGCYRIFNGAPGLADRYKVEHLLRSALEKNQFFFHFQPILDLQTGAYTECEALMRWREPGIGMVRPNQFIPILEESGQIVEVSRWGLQTCLRQMAQWRASGWKGCVSYNLSSYHLLHDSFLQDVRDALALTNLEPSSLKFELSEGLEKQPRRKVIGVLTELKDMGVRVVLDNFGGEHSNLAYLLALPLDSLKIDRFFFKGIHQDPKLMSFTNTLIQMGKALNLRIIAERVETDEEARVLVELGVHAIQGHVLSAAMDAEKLDLSSAKEFLPAYQIAG